MVTQRPRQGYTIKLFDLDMFREAFELREILDGYAAELAAKRSNEAEKERLRNMVQECERLAHISGRNQHHRFQELQLGMDIHRTISDLSGNEMLGNLLNGILDKCQHYVWMELMWLDDWQEARDDHARIVEAICSGDASRASELSRKHVRESRENVLKLLQAKSDLQSFLTQKSEK